MNNQKILYKAMKEQLKLSQEDMNEITAEFLLSSLRESSKNKKLSPQQLLQKILKDKN